MWEYFKLSSNPSDERRELLPKIVEKRIRDLRLNHQIMYIYQASGSVSVLNKNMNKLK